MGKDLISEVTCSEPYEWKDPTGEEWEFNAKAMARAGKQQFHVSLPAAAHTHTDTVCIDAGGQPPQRCAVCA